MWRLRSISDGSGRLQKELPAFEGHLFCSRDWRWRGVKDNFRATCSDFCPGPLTGLAKELSRKSAALPKSQRCLSESQNLGRKHLDQEMGKMIKRAQLSGFINLLRLRPRCSNSICAGLVLTEIRDLPRASERERICYRRKRGR